MKLNVTLTHCPLMSLQMTKRYISDPGCKIDLHGLLDKKITCGIPVLEYHIYSCLETCWHKIFDHTFTLPLHTFPIIIIYYVHPFKGNFTKHSFTTFTMYCKLMAMVMLQYSVQVCWYTGVVKHTKFHQTYIRFCCIFTIKCQIMSFRPVIGSIRILSLHD